MLELNSISSQNTRSGEKKASLYMKAVRRKQVDHLELPFYILLAFEQNSILKLELSAEMHQIAQLRKRQQGEKKKQRSHLDYSSEFSSINQGCKGSARWKWRVNPQGKTSREIWFWLKSLHIKQFQSFRAELWNRTLNFLSQTTFCSFFHILFFYIQYKVAVYWI